MCIAHSDESSLLLFVLLCLFLFVCFPSLEAILSCKHKFSKGMSLRIEWKKIQSQEVSFVYYNGEFTGMVLQAWTNGLICHSLA